MTGHGKGCHLRESWRTHIRDTRLIGGTAVLVLADALYSQFPVVVALEVSVFCHQRDTGYILLSLMNNRVIYLQPALVGSSIELDTSRHSANQGRAFLQLNRRTELDCHHWQRQWTALQSGYAIAWDESLDCVTQLTPMATLPSPPSYPLQCPPTSWLTNCCLTRAARERWAPPGVPTVSVKCGPHEILISNSVPHF